MARRKGHSASTSGAQSPVQAKQEQKTDSIDFTEEKLITKSDSITSKSKITGSENQSIDAGSEKKPADNTFTDSENATRKLGNKPHNLTIKTEEEMVEKNFSEPSDNQLSQNNDLAVSNDADNIVNSKRSPKKDKKRKKKSQKNFNDSLNDRNSEIVGSPSMAACYMNEEPHKKKHKKKKVVNDTKVSSENNAEGNILPSVCIPEVTNFELTDEADTSRVPVKGFGLSKGVDDAPEVGSEANTAKNEEQGKKKHKKRKLDTKRSANDCVLSSENNSEGNLYESVYDPNATTNIELATKVMIVSGIRLSEGVDDTTDIRSGANTVENEEPSKKKRKNRKLDKKGAGNKNELVSDNNLEGNLHPPICNPNATNVELVTEAMTDSQVSLSKGVDITFETRSEANAVENEESSKKKRKKRKMDKKRAENENELASQNNLEGILHPSNCSPNATASVELVNEVKTDSGDSLSKGVDDAPEIRSEANIEANEESSKKKRKRSKKDKKRAMNENEILNENNSEGNLHPSICNSNATTTEVMTDSAVNLSKGVGDTPEIRSEAITVINEERPKEKHKKRKKDKKRVANKSELLNENDSDGNISPSACLPNVTTNIEFPTEAMTVGENVLSNWVDDTSEIRSEANTAKNKDPQKKKHKKKKKTDKISAVNDNELLSGNNSKGNLSIGNPNATNNLGLAAQTMTSDGISSLKAVDAASEIRSESNTVNSETPKKKKKSKRKMIASSVASGSGILNNNLKENIPPLMGSRVSNASVNCELADEYSGEASQSVDQQLTANETSSKGANNSSEINLVSSTLKCESQHKKKEQKKMMIDDQDIRDKGIEAKDIEISQDNRLLPTTKNEIHTPRRFGRRKLLVLDLNGLLCEVIRGYPKTKKPYKRVNRSAVFKRPFCDDFLKFCRENFDIGVWSSRKMENVHGVVNVIMKDFRDDLLFCWSASECTYTRHKTLEDHRKPLVLKKLQKLWNKEAGNLPWGLGDYSPSNTLLIDDSPYKAICNPPYTGVFPYPYNFNDEKDNALGPGGDLRVFLEGLALAEDVESYVREHPFAFVRGSGGQCDEL